MSADRPILLHGDMLAMLPTLGRRFHACVTDPPYGLNFMGRKWDKDIAFQPETWALVGSVMLPGAHLVAFAGTKGAHRMACAIEDAGFEIRDTLAWLYGSGFPKSHNQHGDFEGWGTALKPAYEPIVLARWPMAGKTVAANLAEHRCGAINVDACRVATEGESPSEQRRAAAARSGNFGRLGDKTNGEVGKFRANGDREAGLANYLAGKDGDKLGRWPANVVHDGSEEVLAAFPDSGNGGGPREMTRNPKLDRSDGYGMDKGEAPPSGLSFGDSGSAARFFYNTAPDINCGLCGMPYDASWNATNAVSSSSGTKRGNSAPLDVAASPVRGSAASENPPNDNATGAGKHTAACHQPNDGSAPSSAQTRDSLKLVRNVKSAANLCDCCATVIARALVAAKHNPTAALPQCPASISERSAQILRQHLALYVAAREDTAIITTTESLKTLLGSVFHAIASTTPKSADEPKGSPERSKRIWYSGKADSSDRLQSKHPTVKPVDLMRWLVRLVTPRGGHVLDPFAGSGTTGMACMAEGFDCTLIEREAEYAADIRRRIAHVSGDDTPLFVGAAE